MTRNDCVPCKKQLTNVKLLIVDELGYVPFMAIGAELLCSILS